MNVIAILMAIEQAAAVAKTAQNLLKGLSGHAIDLPPVKAPGGGEVLISADMVNEAIKRGHARADSLESTSDEILARLRAEGKL